MTDTLAIQIEGAVPYADALALQEELVARRIEDAIPDCAILLQHQPVVTLGSRGRRDALLRSEDELRAAGVELYHASRGGDVTYHAPGQLIIYPILKLGGSEADSHGYLCNLEEIAIRTAGDFGVAAFRRSGKTGAWTASGKLAAIGIRLRRWVTFHGMSFNVDLDLAGFRHIVPCGLEGESVVSLQGLLGEGAPTLAAVRERVCANFSEVCQRPFAATIDAVDCADARLQIDALGA